MTRRTLPRLSKLDTIRKQIAEQRQWIEDHGRDEHGYIERYGDPKYTDTWYGDGGRAIYKADHDALVALERSLPRNAR